MNVLMQMSEMSISKFDETADVISVVWIWKLPGNLRGNLMCTIHIVKMFEEDIIWTPPRNSIKKYCTVSTS